MLEVILAIIPTAGLIVVALIANRGRQHAKAARVQVENDHTTNLRVEGDDRHTENTDLLRQILQDVGGVKSDVRGLRRDVGRLSDADAEHAKQIRELEQTRPRPSKGGN